jgi:hypothetical protein
MTVTLELPDELVERARAAGLLEPAQVARVLEAQLAEENDGRNFFAIARELRSLPGEPMPLKEIQAEVDAVRVDRDSSREAGH